MKNHKYKSGDTIMYRDTEYTYREWTTYSGKQATGFNCNCENLLQHVNVMSFGTITEDEMHRRIDDYLDNGEEYAYLFENNEWICYDLHYPEPQVVSIPEKANVS